MPTLDVILVLLQQYGYFLLFSLAVIEGPIITIMAALLAAQGYFNIFAVYGVVVVGDLVGDLFHYAPGRWGKPLLVRWGNYFGIDREKLAALEERFRTRGGRTLIFGKLTHSAGFLVLVAAGAAEMPISQFLWYNFIATLPKSLFFMLIGYFIGHSYNLLNSYLEKGSLVVFALLCVGGYYWYVRRYPKKREDTDLE
jgi:membrane protein DedA with SNARE-associated domain